MSDRLFRPNHERRVLTTFRHVDELVSQAVSRLEPSTSATFLSEFVLDARSDQHQMATDCLERLRDLMRRFLENHQIPVSKPNVSALWAAHTACLHARLSVEELRASPMRGCGQLTPDAERELEALATALSDVLQGMTEFLAPPPPSPSSPGQAG